MNTEQSLTDTTVSPQRLDEMKGAIRSFLSQSNVYDSIRNIIDTYVSEKGGASVSDDPDEIMRVIREKGLLQELVSKMRSETDGKVKKSVPPFQLASGQFYLHMRISNSRAFVDNVDLSPAAALNHSMFTTIHFGNQRFCSSHVMCSTNPKFDEDFLFTLDTSPYGCGSSDLLELSAPVHIEVFRENKCENIAEILGENTFDWRKVLKTGYLGLTVELCGRNPGIPSGIIELQLELLPGKKAVFTEDEISSTLEKQRLAISTADREFLLYAKRWWNEYLSYSPSYRERKVKLFASTTNGRMVPVTHFVFPLQVDFGLSSPEEAARFVSLFKVSDATPSYLNSIESDSSGGWLSPSTFLSQRQGSQCNHAALLCSLLLGFGLSSYCGIGLSKSGDPVVFVVSLQQGKTGVNAFLWDPVTGNRFICTGSHSFATVDCLFNSKSFYANLQSSNDILNTSFEVDNENLWKPINPLKLRLVPKLPHPPILCKSVDVPVSEKLLESNLRKALISHRDSIGATTLFNDNLSYVLAQALQNYEAERKMRTVPDTHFFTQCVKGVLGPGKTFKAVPINVAHTNEKLIMQTLLSFDTGKEIGEVIAENASFGLRCQIFPYPEGVVSVWVLLAVSYSNVS